MQLVNFGSSGLKVSQLGFGAGHIGSPEMDGNHVEMLLSAALDMGITLFDTAKGYGLSEERLGRFISSHRSRIILSTKVGYSVPGFEDWTYDCIIEGVHQALRTLQTGYIDIVHLHSCPLHILQNNGVTDALLQMKEHGKIRVAAYSGENEELSFTISSELFGSVQTSINIFDQASKNNFCGKARSNGIGIIGKRPLGNCPWKYSEQPTGMYAEEYWNRMKAMELDFGNEWAQIAIRFAGWHGGADSIISGTQSITHLKQITEFVETGPLEASLVQFLEVKYLQSGQNWRGEI